MMAARKRSPEGTMQQSVAAPSPEVQEPESSRAPGVNRAIAILRVLAESSDPMGVNAIARELKIVPSTCYHIVRALEAEGFVQSDEGDKRYSLGLGILSLAREALNGSLPVRIIQYELDRLAAEFGVTATFVQFTGGPHKLLLATARPAMPFSVRMDAGMTLPAFSGGSGLCLAAYSNLPSHELRNAFDDLVWENPPKFKAWLDDIENVRSRGYAIDNGKWVTGFTILASPVFANNMIFGAVTALFATSQLDAPQQLALVGAVREIGRRLSI